MKTFDLTRYLNKRMLFVTLGMMVFVQIIMNVLPFGNSFDVSKGILNITIIFTAKEGYEMLAAQSPAGQEAFRFIIITDFFVAAIYGVLMATIIHLLAKNTIKSRLVKRIMVETALFAGISNIIANIFVLIMLDTITKPVYWISSMANIFTIGKAVFFVLSVAIIVLLSVLKLLNQLKIKSSFTSRANPS